MISLGRKQGTRNGGYLGGLMIRGGQSSAGARGGGYHIHAHIARRGATLWGTGLLALALVAIVKAAVGSDTLRNGTVDHLTMGAILSNVADLQAPVAVQDERRVH